LSTKPSTQAPRTSKIHILQAPTHGRLIEIVTFIIAIGVIMPTIKVKGMSCQHCVASVTKALSEIDGISDVVVDLAKGTATFTEKTSVARETINKAVAAIGFEVVED